ncbi:nucleotidyltransferase [Aeromonas rivipollensis]|uniref:nucleotidyltransferase domain-containing protein n=1 Tax=Aeromonas rivipollensis TaxID=948519 RepID=UPI0038CF7CA3
MPTQLAEDYLVALVDELSISEMRYEQAERSYASLGAWLHRSESTVVDYDPQVYVQGSFRLGTAIRPLTDEEEYDIDCVCLLRNIKTSDLTQKDLKTLIGDEIKAYRKAQNMVKQVREGRRCWVLAYADGAQFHMDIVPAIPNAQQQRSMLESRGFDVKWSETAIAITDIHSSVYENVADDWPRSNPKGYAEWFKLRMGGLFEKRKRLLAESIKANVEEIPDYKIRTPLQSAIMILKRHRDGMFKDRPDESPISIIISTLAAYAYSGEENIADALLSILSQMDSFIERNGHQCMIRNPSDPLENFADKWPQHPERESAFFEWLEQARLDFGELTRQVEKRCLVESIHPRMGAIADRAAARLPPPGSMLRSVVTASSVASSELAFPNTRREPTTPKGFA